MSRSFSLGSRQVCTRAEAANSAMTPLTGRMAWPSLRLFLLLLYGVAGDDCTEQMLVASATRPRIRMLPKCNVFLSSVFEVSLKFYQADVQATFEEWAAQSANSSIPSLRACMPGTCSEEHVPAVAYLICLMATREPRCVEMLDISSWEAEVPGFAAVSGVLLAQGPAVDFITWDLSDAGSSSALLASVTLFFFLFCPIFYCFQVPFYEV